MREYVKRVIAKNLFTEDFYFRDCDGNQYENNGTTKEKVREVLRDGYIKDAHLYYTSDKSIAFFMDIVMKNRHLMEITTTHVPKGYTQRLTAAVENNCGADEYGLRNPMSSTVRDYLKSDQFTMQKNISENFFFTTCQGTNLTKSVFIDEFDLKNMDVVDGIRFEDWTTDPESYSTDGFYKYSFYNQENLFQFAGKLDDRNMQFEAEDKNGKISFGREFPCD